MLIHPPEMTTQGTRVRVSARVEAESEPFAGGEDIWFEVDRSDQDSISDRADAFLVALLPVAMSLGEPLEVRGEVSPRLLRGTRDVQAILTAWWPKRFRQIELRCSSISVSRFSPSPAGVGLAFSGGVDSFHTLLQHHAGNEPLEPYRLTHAVMVSGFDLDVEDPVREAALRSIYEPALSELSIRMILLRTNFRSILGAGRRSPGYDYLHGGLLIAAAHVLGPLFRVFSIPGSTSWRDLVPEGAHPLIDPRLSSESLQITHEGCEASRVEKTAALIDWPPAFSRLRVCSNRNWNNIEVSRSRVINCGECDKCVRTMVSLEILGALDRFETFARPLSRAKIRRAPSGSKVSDLFMRQNLAAAASDGQSAMAFDLRMNLIRNRVRRWIDRFRRRFRQRPRS